MTIHIDCSTACLLGADSVMAPGAPAVTAGAALHTAAGPATGLALHAAARSATGLALHAVAPVASDSALHADARPATRVALDAAMRMAFGGGRLTALAALAALGAGAAGCTSSPAWPASPTAATQLAHFDAAQGSMAEGLAVRGKTAYIGYAGSGQIVTVNLDTGTTAPYSSLPQPIAGKGFVSGMTLHGDDLYGALVSFVPDVQPGVYRVAASGAAGTPATLFAKHAEMVFPNGMVFDDAGQMYVTDSAAGAVFRVSTAGAVTKWASGPLLTGGKDGCGAAGVGVPFDIGANGIVIDDGALIVTNTDHGSLVRIPIQADGSAGAPAEIAGPSCAELNGADGLAVAPNGDFIVAVNHQNKLARIDAAGHITTLLAGAPLDFPASVTFEDGALYVGNFAFLDAANPGVLRVR